MEAACVCVFAHTDMYPQKSRMRKLLGKMQLGDRNPFSKGRGGTFSGVDTGCAEAAVKVEPAPHHC